MTIAYKPKNGFWSSRYSYDTSCFAQIDKKLLSFSEAIDGAQNDENELAWEHRDDSAKCVFYGGAQTLPYIKLTVNDNPSKNKVYRSMSIEGSYLLGSQTQFFANNSSQQTQLRQTVYNGVVEKGGIFYSGVGRVGQVSTGNSLKIIGEITRAVLPVDIPEFLGDNTPDEWTSGTSVVILQVRPIGGSFSSSSSQDVIDGTLTETTKYFIGSRAGGVMRVVAPQVADGQIVFNDPNLYVNGRNTPHSELDNRFLPLIDGPKRVGTWFGSTATNEVAATSGDFVDAINNSDARIFLFESSDESINGEDPRVSTLI